MTSPNLRRFLVPLGLALLLAFAFRAAGWQGLAATGGGILMWLLLHFTRLVTVLRRATNRPVGHTDSAVVLNARLRSGLPLLQVLALTRALGKALTPPGTQPERFGWTDAGGAKVICEFGSGRLTGWQLVRPPEVPQDGNEHQARPDSGPHADMHISPWGHLPNRHPAPVKSLFLRPQQPKGNS